VSSLPQKVAEARADIVEMVSHPMSIRQLSYMIQSALRKGDHLFPPGYTGEAAAGDIEFITRMAELYTATPEMLDLIVHAAKSMPPTPLRREDLPSQSGFLWLPKAVRIVDIGGESVPVKAVSWHEETLGGRLEYSEPKAERGVLLHLYVENGSEIDRAFSSLPPKIRHEVLAVSPRLGLVHVESVGFNRLTWTLDTRAMDATPEERGRYARQMRDIHDGTLLGDGQAEPDGSFKVQTREGHIIRVMPDPIVQFLAAYWHFVGSELTDIDRDPLPRSMIRWLRRLQMPEGPVSVVRLRRRKGSGEGVGGWTLGYRHVRRGHWRLQWFGSDRLGTRHQQAIWISPTVCGPEDAPLRVRDVVNVVAR
jgi:hypothetical protein